MPKPTKKLLEGYTTGTHATALVGGLLREYFYEEIVDTIVVELPDNKRANISICREDRYTFSTIKVDNDDLDVTKGVKITLSLLLSQPTQIKPQTPSVLSINSLKLYIYAGDGVGVVTKKGLKIPPNYPAINPTPLSMMVDVAREMVDSSVEESLYLIFSIKDGEEIAKSTANAKVGVVGGLSILGTKGVVKPISATAYIDSIATELSVLEASGVREIIFTLGNSAYDMARERYDELSIIEVGNFVYDSLELLEGRGFDRVLFITSVAKMTKVAQGCKNTHNRFGGIDFNIVNSWIEECGIERVEHGATTLRAILNSMVESKPFVEFVNQKASLQMREWVGGGVLLDSVIVPS
jgi:cobalt-precorrin-5B (C1)-methyltransferase